MDADSDHSPPPHGAARWRAVPLGAIALPVIALAVVVSHAWLIRRGMRFDDPSWCFHYGRRIAEGAAPYRDYVYQGGPMPLYVDAVFQRWFGASYTASLDAAMAVTILRVFAVWLIAHRLAGPVAAALLAVWCILDPTFAMPYDASTSYAQLFILLAGLALVRAAPGDASIDAAVVAPDTAARDRLAPAHERRTRTYLALAGASAGLVVASRQGAGAMIAVVLLAASLVLPVRRMYFTRPRLVALWCGFAAGLVVVFGPLAIAGVLGPALQQMFVDAPAKQGIHGITAVADALSGGGFDALYRSWWGGFLVFVGLSAATVAAVIYLVARGRELASHTVAFVALVALVLAGLYLRFALLGWFTDLPRMFLTVTTVLALAAPARLRQWFGIEPLVAIGLGALPLASEWAMQASLPGRDASDVPSLVTGALLITLATGHLTRRSKTLVCGALAIAAIVHFTASSRLRINPLIDRDAADGTLRDDKLRSNNPVMRGLGISEPRRKAVEWLASQVPPGSTCFIYGNLPALYDVLDCHNPTRIDNTAVGALSVSDADQAIAALRRDLPSFLIAHDRTAMVPPLLPARDGQLASYGWFDPGPIRLLHMGLHTLLDQYEPVGVVGDILGEALATRADAAPDHVNAIRLYRRKH